MAISNDIITNRLDKKINYGVTRTDYDSFKSVVNESIPSPIPNPSHDLWMESHLIPDGVTGWNNPTSPYTAQDPPAVNTEQVEVWMYNPTASQGDRVGFGAQATGIGDVKGVYELTLDPSVSSKRTWLVSSEPGNPYAPLITNFIRTTYGAKYAPRFVVGPKSYTVNSDGSVNVGAGTITCNYDGVRKSKTKIRDNVFIGSNTSLVAPLTIEEDSVIGAGSVITKNVKKKSLALTRSLQTEIKNYKRKSK